MILCFARLVLVLVLQRRRAVGDEARSINQIISDFMCSKPLLVGGVHEELGRERHVWQVVGELHPAHERVVAATRMLLAND